MEWMLGKKGIRVCKGIVRVWVSNVRRSSMKVGNTVAAGKSDNYCDELRQLLR